MLNSNALEPFSIIKYNNTKVYKHTQTYNNDYNIINNTCFRPAYVHCVIYICNT